MRSVPRFLCLFVLPFPFVTGCSDSSVDPEPTPIQLDNPQRRAVIQKTTTNQTLKIGGDAVVQVFGEDMRYTLDIDTADANGNATFTSTLDFASFEMDSDLAGTRTGGMDPATMMMRPTNEAMRAARGLSFSGMVSTNGDIHGLDDLGELRTQILKNLEKRTLPPELTGTTVMEEFVELEFGQDRISALIEQVSLPRPLEPLTEGFTWSARSTSSFGAAQLPTQTNFTIASVTPDEIVVREKVESVDDTNASEVFRRAMSLDGSVEFVFNRASATYHINPETGWVTRYTQTLAFNLNLDLYGVAMNVIMKVTRNGETYTE